jgi:hypothetical protein
MQIKRILGLAVAVAITVGTSMAADAKNNLPYPYNNKAANLQAMQWYAQQQAAQGNYGYGLYGNPYYNSSLYNNSFYANPYGYNNYNTVNPYYGNLGGGYWY